MSGSTGWSRQLGPVAPLAEDAEFLRQVYLDLVGTIPSAAEAQAFFENQSPHKRRELIDQLLDSPRYARHWANVFDVLLMERRQGKRIPPAEWQAYLLESFTENKPYDQLVRDVLSADGTEEKHRPAARFYLDREGDTHQLTRDIGRIVYGRDLQCAQCHDHPLINDYLQSEYYGLYAFLNRSFIFPEKPKRNEKIFFFAERAEGEVTYESVFIPKSQWTTGPRLPGGKPIEEPVFAGDDAYVVKPDKNVRPVPKYSRRMQLAKMVAQSDAFDRNIVNRLWRHMMGHGLIEPVDLHHAANPASHPQLLKLLADQFTAMGYDIKALLRELALSRTYQRAIEMDGQLERQIEDALRRLPAIEAEEERMGQALAVSREAFTEARDQLEKASKAESDAGRKLTKAKDARKSAENSIKALKSAQEQLAAKQQMAQRLVDAAEKTKQTVEKLPDDKELAAAAATLKTRADQLTAEVKELSTKLEKQTTAAKSAEEKLPAAEQACEEAATALEAAKNETEQARAKHATALPNYTAHKAAQQTIQRQLDQARQFTDYAMRRTSVQEARRATAEALTDLQAASQATDAAAAAINLPELEAALACGRTEQEENAKALETARADLANKEQQVRTVVEAFAKVNATLEIVPDDPDLKLAAKKLESSRDQLTKDFEPIRRNIASLEENAKKVAGAVVDAQSAVDAVSAELLPLRQAAEKLERQADMAAQRMVSERSAADATYDHMTQMWSTELAVGSLKPLSPEQLAWSLMQALGIVDRHRAEAQAELAKKAAEKAAADKEQAKGEDEGDQPGGGVDTTQLIPPEQIEQAVYDRLKGHAGEFVSLFAPGRGQPQQDFFATVDQALFFANAGQIRNWIKPGEDNLTERLNKIEDPTQLARQLYLTVLTRWPKDAEITEVEEYLATRPDNRSAAIEEMVWGLLTSTEFRFNH